jgi:hypothetical protein
MDSTICSRSSIQSPFSGWLIFQNLLNILLIANYMEVLQLVGSAFLGKTSDLIAELNKDKKADVRGRSYFKDWGERLGECQEACPLMKERSAGQ